MLLFCPNRKPMIWIADRVRLPARAKLISAVSRPSLHLLTTIPPLNVKVITKIAILQLAGTVLKITLN